VSLWATILRATHYFDPSILWGLAVPIAAAWAVREARRAGLDPLTAFGACLCAVLVGIWGSHALGVVVYHRIGESGAWWRFWVGGKSYYGGLIGGAVAALVYLRIRRAPVLVHADAIAPAVGLGYAVGRLGCFLNGDDFGIRAGAWGVQYPSGTQAFDVHVDHGWIAPTDALSLPVHPTQLYHAVVGIALCVWLTRVRSETPGRRLVLLAAGYGAARFALEWLRGDFERFVGPFSLQQLISLSLIAAAAALHVRSTRMAPAAQLSEAQ
jgi:phosphatidylglycerol:prolipoprotein diacylglycerol transferase